MPYLSPFQLSSFINFTIQSSEKSSGCLLSYPISLTASDVVLPMQTICWVIPLVVLSMASAAEGDAKVTMLIRLSFKKSSMNPAG